MTAGIITNHGVGDALLLQFPGRRKEEFEYLKSAKWKKILWFFTGAATLAPWFIFKHVYSLGLTPDDQKLSFHQDAPKLFWDKVINGKPLWINPKFVNRVYQGLDVIRVRQASVV